MAIRYVDPSRGVNGVGSEADPYNTPIGATAGAGDQLLFKRGTTWLATERYQPSVTGTAEARIKFGAYGDGPRPILHGQDSVDLAMQITDHAYIDIEGLEFTRYTRCGPYLASTGDDDTRVRNIRIIDCLVHEIEGNTAATGIQGWGTGIEVIDTIVTRIEADGMWFRGGGLRLARNTVSMCSLYGGGFGDCIQIDNCDLGLIIEDCVIDHTNSTDKQALLIRQDGGGQSNARVSGCIIVGATVAGAGLVTVYGALGVNFYSNRFEMQNNAAIFYLKEGSNLAAGKVVGNLFIGNGTQGRAVGSDDPSGVIHAYNNTVIGVDQGFNLGTQGYAANNIVHTCARAAIYAETFKKNNCIFANATTGGMTYDGTHITSDPLLDASYRLGAASPCLNAGTMIDGVVLKDFYGKDIVASPDIGAMQVYAARSAIASRSAITRSSITRNQSGDRAPYG